MEDRNTQLQVVTSVGNAWIVCRSKSHPGRIYYFNTVSGEAAWNLSAMEIEKAKTRTKILGNHEAVLGCPEPNEPPGESSSQVPPTTNPNFVLPRVYNKQVINNKFPNSTFTPDPNLQYALTSINPLTWKMPVVPSFNAVWDVPPSQQFFIAPSVAQDTSQATALNTANQPTLHQRNMSVQTCMPMSKRFEKKCFGNRTTPMRGVRKNHNKYYHRFQNQRARNINKRMFQNDINSVPLNDLRRKISAKRSIVNTCTRKSDNNVNEDTETYAPNTDEETHHAAKLGKQIEKGTSNGPSQPKSKLDLKPLRDLAVAEAKLDCWYIVPDSSVLLCNLMYLIMVIESDVDCCLMVPQYVMMKLQAIAFSSARTKFRARNAIRLLTQQFDAGSAFITSDESSLTGDDECTHVFNSCLFLVKGNNHVVLLSNNIDMLKYKYTTHIPIFTIPELKELLTSVSFPQNNNTSPLKDHNRLIKITVTNDINTNLDVEVDPEVTTIESFIKLDGEETIGMPNTKDDGVLSIDLAETSKSTVDAEVQTDHTVESADARLGDTYKNYDLDETMSATAIKTNNLNINKCNSQNQDLDHSNCRRREFRLKRGRNEKPKETSNSTINKKQFKWRRRNIASTAQADESNLCNAKTVGLKSNSVQEQQIITNGSCNETAPQKEANHADLLAFKSSSNVWCSNTDDSGSSNSIQRFVFDKSIVVDETSTSGIISNTGSNVDSEIVTTVNQRNLNSKQSEMKNVMFEVTSDNMEELLEMRCDEWVSRFSQIMEHVLTEILQQEPGFVDSKWQPPWTIREATHCIAIKFKRYSAVVDAAYKLSDVLKGVCDNRGGIITENLKPSQYMKIYSYGVYLVDTLQNMQNCEDLDIASQSLKELLNDIQNGIQNEFLVDYPPKYTNTVGKPPQVCPYEANEHEDVPEVPQNLLDTSTNNLRSNKRTFQEQEEREREVKFIRNIDIEYSPFNSLKTHKKCSDKDYGNERVKKSVSPNSESNIKENVYHGYDYLLDYVEDYEYGDQDYNSEYGFYYDHERGEYVETLNKHEYGQSEMNVNNTNKDHQFKYFVGEFLKEIKDTFGQVQTMCEAYYKDINGPRKIDSIKKKEMQEKASKSQLLIEDLYKSLDSILQRENENPGNSIKSFLKTTQVDENMCFEYRSIITKCKDQAGLVLTTIGLIINSMNS